MTKVKPLRIWFAAAVILCLPLTDEIPTGKDCLCKGRGQLGNGQCGRCIVCYIQNSLERDAACEVSKPVLDGCQQDIDRVQSRCPPKPPHSAKGNNGQNVNLGVGSIILIAIGGIFGVILLVSSGAAWVKRDRIQAWLRNRPLLIPQDDPSTQAPLGHQPVVPMQVRKGVVAKRNVLKDDVSKRCVPKGDEAASGTPKAPAASIAERASTSQTHARQPAETQGATECFHGDGSLPTSMQDVHPIPDRIPQDSQDFASHNSMQEYRNLQSLDAPSSASSTSFPSGARRLLDAPHANDMQHSFPPVSENSAQQDSLREHNPHNIQSLTAPSEVSDFSFPSGPYHTLAGANADGSDSSTAHLSTAHQAATAAHVHNLIQTVVPGMQPGGTTDIRQLQNPRGANEPSSGYGTGDQETIQINAAVVVVNVVANTVNIVKKSTPEALVPDTNKMPVQESMTVNDGRDETLEKRTVTKHIRLSECRPIQETGYGTFPSRDNVDDEPTDPLLSRNDGGDDSDNDDKNDVDYDAAAIQVSASTMDRGNGNQENQNQSPTDISNFISKRFPEDVDIVPSIQNTEMLGKRCPPKSASSDEEETVIKVS